MNSRPEIYQSNRAAIGKMLEATGCDTIAASMTLLAAAGWTLRKSADQFGVQYQCFRRLARKYKIQFPDGRA